MLEDGGVGGIRDFGGDFKTAVDGAGVENENIRPGFSKAFFGEAEEAGIFANTGKGGGGEAFKLNAKHVDDVDVGEHGVEIVGEMEICLG